jgi:hypothetical protein
MNVTTYSPKHVYDPLGAFALADHEHVHDSVRIVSQLKLSSESGKDLLVGRITRAESWRREIMEDTENPAEAAVAAVYAPLEALIRRWRSPP